MKKILSLLILSLLVVSCYEEIVLPAGNEEPVVVMNAQMNTGETTHEVHLSVSRNNRVWGLDGADVKVTVNGTTAIAAVQVSDESSGWNPGYQPWENVYAFDADLRPGDEVRIDARKDAFQVSATVTAPPAVTLASIDTSSVRMAYMDDTSDYLQVKVGFRDLPGDTWYRVAASMETEFAYLDDEGNPHPGYSGAQTWWMSPETGFDPVISEGGGKSGGLDLAALLSADNTYNCFSDNTFRDQDCTIRPLFDPYVIYGYYDQYMFPDLEDYSEYGTVYEIISRMPYSSRRKARLQVRTIDFAQYHYLKALQNLETYGTEMTFLVEPTTLPSNVEGGLGFVGLETVSEVVFYEKEEVLPPSGERFLY